MSLIDRPSAPVRTLNAVEPRRFRYTDEQRDAHKALVYQRSAAYKAALAGHPSVAPYDHEAEATAEVLVLLALPLSQALDLRTDCETSPHAWKQAICADMRRQMTDRTIIDTDPTPPHGTGRPA